MKRLALALLLAGCGGGFSDADAKSTTDSARAQAMALSLCAVGAGTCEASEVRGLERASFCASASILYRHDLPPVDAGVACQPR